MGHWYGEIRYIRNISRFYINDMFMSSCIDNSLKPKTFRSMIMKIIMGLFFTCSLMYT